MKPLPFTDTVATVLFYVAFAIFVAVEVRGAWASWRGRPAGRRDPSYVAVIVSIVVGLGGGFALATDVPGAAIGVARWPVFVVGVVVMIIGAAARQWAMTVLGSSFTFDVRASPEQKVIDDPPYRWVRHPSYTASLVVFVGIGLALGNWLSLIVVVVVPLVGFLNRIRVEEAVLLAEIGEPYRRYAATHARLVPGLW